MINICKIFKNNITYVEYARSGIGYYTQNLKYAKELVNNGWKYKTSKGFRLVPPEVSIVDLTDYRKAMCYQNLFFNYIYYIFLKKLLKQNRLNSVWKSLKAYNPLISILWINFLKL